MPDTEGEAEPGFRAEGSDIVGMGSDSAGVSVSPSEGNGSAAAATVLPPMIDFTAFQFAAPSSTTRIGAVSELEPHL